MKALVVMVGQVVGVAVIGIALSHFFHSVVLPALLAMRR